MSSHFHRGFRFRCAMVRPSLFANQHVTQTLIPTSIACGLWYRRITELHEVDPEPSVPLPKLWTVPPAFGKASFNPIYGLIPPPRKRKRETADDLAVSNFKRIRLVSKIDRLRRPGFCTPVNDASSKRQSVQVSAVPGCTTHSGALRIDELQRLCGMRSIPYVKGLFRHPI